MAAEMHHIGSSPYQILPSTQEDAAAIHACSKRAFATSYLHEVSYPKEKAHLTSPEELFAWRVRRLQRAMQANDFLHFKVTPKDEPAKVVAYSSWFKPGHFKGNKTLADTFVQSASRTSPEMKVQSDTTGQGVPEPPPPDDQKAEDFPACMDVSMQGLFLGKLDEERKKIWGDDANYWCKSPQVLFDSYLLLSLLDLAAIAVDPEYQRRGIATLLMKQGLEWADADGLPTYLEATPEGALMYPKFGFEKVREYGFFDGKYVVEFHIRPPANRQ